MQLLTCGISEPAALEVVSENSEFISTHSLCKFDAENATAVILEVGKNGIEGRGVGVDS